MRYSFNSIQTAGTLTSIAGTDSSGDPIVVIRTADAGVSFPYTFFLLDPGVGSCQGFAFNHTGANSLTGIYFQTSVLPNGTCDSISSPLYDATGVRLNAAALLAPSNAPDALAAQAQLEEEARLSHPVPHLNPQDLSQLINWANAVLSE